MGVDPNETVRLVLTNGVQDLPTRKPLNGVVAVNDNFVATLTFADGSVGAITYVGAGAPELLRSTLAAIRIAQALDTGAPQEVVQ